MFGQRLLGGDGAPMNMEPLAGWQHWPEKDIVAAAEDTALPGMRTYAIHAGDFADELIAEEDEHVGALLRDEIAAIHIYTTVRQSEVG